MTRPNPLKILLSWTVLMLVLAPILIYTSSTGSVGGEQKPLTTLVTMLLVTVLGAALICVVTPFFFKDWLQTNKWFISLAIFLLLPSSIFLWQYYFETPYSYVEQFRENNGDKIEIKTKYYDNNNEVVRSKSFWKNSKKDSTWTIYGKDGKVLSEKVYRNDSLLDKR